MSTQKYSVTPHPVETILTWVKSGEIAIPEIQRPFVWEATKVRNLLDSLYHGFPVGYLITWRNPNVKLKDGTTSSGKRILIDGQQRVTALMAALLGRDVLTKDYETTRITIAFNPMQEKFEVANPAIKRDSAWIHDVASVFAPDASLTALTDQYTKSNPECDRNVTSLVLERLRKIVYNHVGIIDLSDDLDIETVTEIFIRVNSAGTELSQADFAMSKIAVNETHGGNTLRKAIEYFCHVSVAPEFLDKIEKTDTLFAQSDFLRQMKWLRSVKDEIYDPKYTDMLRVAFTSEFRRGKLQDLVALLSGRNFETRQYQEEIVEDSFKKLSSGISAFISQTHFERFTMILRSAGFITSDLIGGMNNVNFAYIVYLSGRAQNLSAADLERLVRRWYAMSVLTSRYGGSIETAFDQDIRQIDAQGLVAYSESVLENELPDSFWTGMLPQLMDTPAVNSPYFLAWQAAQVKAGDKGFLSSDITTTDLLLNRGDVHHLYPRNFLKKDGLTRGQYNQIANLVRAQSEINIAIGDKSPEVYFADLRTQTERGTKKYGGITDREALLENFRENCVPAGMIDGSVLAYEDFLAERRTLMALKIKGWYKAL
jgi:hypothetical protein